MSYCLLCIRQINWIELNDYYLYHILPLTVKSSQAQEYLFPGRQIATSSYIVYWWWYEMYSMFNDAEFFCQLNAKFDVDRGKRVKSATLVIYSVLFVCHTLAGRVQIDGRSAALTIIVSVFEGQFLRRFRLL